MENEKELATKATKARPRFILPLGIVLLFLVSFLTHFVTRNSPSFILQVLFGIPTGFLALLLVPGVVASEALIPLRYRNIGFSVFLGLILQVFLIQLRYLLEFFSLITLPFQAWLFGSNLVFLASGVVVLQSKRSNCDFRTSLQLTYGWRFVFLLVISLVLRFSLLSYAQGTLAPDSALYADFARQIIYGEFDSQVLNDVAVIELRTGFDYVAHHAFTYVFALSYTIVEPSTSGPVFILVVVGVLLLFPVYEICKFHFGEKAALWTCGIVAVHPLFVFHSVVGYGPEIVSLLYILYSALLLGKHEGIVLNFGMAGILLGLADATWYPNFYILCVLLPAAAILEHVWFHKGEMKFTVLLPLVLAARLCYLNLPVFAFLWAVILSSAFLGKRIQNSEPSKPLSFYSALLATVIAFRLPLQIISAGSANSLPNLEGPSPLSALIVSDVTGKLLQFMSFLICHFSPVVLILLLLALLIRKNRTAICLTILGTVAAFGTFIVLGAIPDSLQFIYFYSDSRFFLLIVLIFTIAAGTLFLSPSNAKHIDTQPPSQIRQRRLTVLIMSVILIGFIPSYQMYPSGLSLIHMEDRYGWKDLESIIDPLGSEDTVFLANRVREFVWFTGRDCAFLSFTNIGIPNSNASAEVLALSREFNAKYLLMDDYTTTKWDTLEYLLHDVMFVDDKAILNISVLSTAYGNNIIGPVDSLVLIAENEPNLYGRFSRVFAIEPACFSRTQNITVLSPGWEATNAGIVLNESGSTELVIGEQASNTTIQRTLPLDMTVGTGFMLFEIEERGAVVYEIEILGGNDELIGKGEWVGDNLFMCHFGERIVQDIRITTIGTPGDSILIRSITLWEGI